MEFTNTADLKDIILEILRSKEQFTDIHIEEGEEVMWRRPLGLDKVGDFITTDRKMLEDFLNQINPGWKDIMDRNGEMNHSTQQGQSRLRINAYYTREKSRISLSVRKHPLNPQPLSKSALPEIAKRMLQLSSKGLFVVTGPTGSAKTTTLASIVHYFNNDARLGQQPRKLHIITIEDPIEFIHERANGVISHKSVGTDCPTFAAGLRAALREKPDVILIGEVLDRETAEVMLHAAESGHLVLATMHTSSAVAAVNKILSFFPDTESVTRRQTLAANLIGVCGQVMMPLANGNEFTVIAETLINNNAQVFDMISQGKTVDLQTYLEKGAEGSQSLNTQLLELFKAQKITGEVAVRSSYDPFSMMMKVKNAMGGSK